METIQTIPAAVAALIPIGQLKVTKGNLKAYADSIKRLEESLEKCPKIGATDGMTEHPAIFHYFYGSTDIYICEYDRNNLMYGRAILGGDVGNSEWGYFNLPDLTSLVKLNIDYYFDGQSVEAALYSKYPDYFKKPFSLWEDTALTKNGPLPAAYKEKPYQYIRTKGGTVLSNGKGEVFLQGDDETVFFRDCNRAKQHGRRLSEVMDGYFPD